MRFNESSITQRDLFCSRPGIMAYDDDTTTERSRQAKSVVGRERRRGQEHQLATTGRVVEAMVLTKDIDQSGNSVNRSVTYRFTNADGRTIEAGATWESPSGTR
jgi:hypothetical protein